MEKCRVKNYGYLKDDSQPRIGEIRGTLEEEVVLKEYEKFERNF